MKLHFFNQTSRNVMKEEKLIKKVLSYEKRPLVMNIIFVTDEIIHKMNLEKRNVDRVTDVISFALADSCEPGILIEEEIGDIFIDLDQAERQALEYGHTIEREVGFLATHGYLHLLGYDHMVPEDEKIMFELQEKILNLANLKRGDSNENK